MDLPFITDKTFSKQDYRNKELPKAEYDSCSFINCNFSESYLSYVSFTDCEFLDCNLSGVKIKDTQFKDVLFKDCKLLGINFSECSDFLFSIKAEDSNFSFSTFLGKNLNKPLFKNCNLEQVDFTEAHLAYTIFQDCNLKHAIFDNSNLEHADLRTAILFNINPERNRLKNAKFSKEGALNLLYSYQIIIQ